MDINIRTVSVFDKKSKISGYIYEASLIDGDKILSQKSLKYESDIKKSNTQNQSKKILSKSLERFINEINDEFQCENITVESKPNAPEISLIDKDILKENNPNVKFSTLFDPLIFREKNLLLNNNVFGVDYTQSFEEEHDENFEDFEDFEDFEYKKRTEKKTELKEKGNNQFRTRRKARQTNNEIKEKIKENKDSRFRKESSKKRKEPISDINCDDLDLFISKMTDNKNVTDLLFNNNIVKNKRTEEFFVNLAVTYNIERKRFGVGFEIYASEKNMLHAVQPLFKQIFISKGERNETGVRVVDFIKSRLTSLVKEEKKISFNTLQSNGYITDEIYKMLNETKLNESISLLKHKTPLFIKTRDNCKKLIDLDIKLHLDELKSPKTVAIWTDGSVNNTDHVSGSGVLIRHDGKEEMLKSKNEKACNNHAEFKAVYMAIKKVVTTPEYKNKKIIIVSDSDAIAYCLRNKKLGIKNNKHSYLNEISYLLDHNKLDIHFHNVKSHVHERINKDQKNDLFDFYYNNIADTLAREAAGIVDKKKNKRRIQNKSKIKV